jgi:hypothetical protein
MRPVPHLIDRRNRAGEYAMSFMVPLFLLRTIDPLFALACATVLAALYMKFTFGRADGHLVHRIYRLGVPLGGLLDPRVVRYVP